MSRVTNVLLVVSPITDDEEQAVHDCLVRVREACDGQELRNIAVDESGALWGGSKMPETDVYAGAFNHADNLNEVVFAGVWPVDMDAQLLICEQEDLIFKKIWELSNGKWRHR